MLGYPFGNLDIRNSLCTCLLLAAVVLMFTLTFPLSDRIDAFMCGS